MINFYGIRHLILISVFIFIITILVFPQTATLTSTFSLHDENGVSIPFQNGIPVPSFAKQDRQIIDLDGIWKKQRFNADHNISLAARDSSGYNNVLIESQDRFSPSYNDSNWETKYIPSVENTMHTAPVTPEFYQDGVWYRRTFNVPDSLNGKFSKLMFYAVNYTADIWLNGQYLGYHEGGYTSFAFDVSKYLNYNGSNLLAVRVDNPPWGTRNDIVPYTNCDWFNYTGIVHDVYLEVSNPVSVIRANIVPMDINGNIKTNIVLLNKSGISSNPNVQIDIYNAHVDSANIQSERASFLIGPSAQVTGTTNESLVIKNDSVALWSTQLTVNNPLLWSPKNPNLYIMKITVKNSGKVIDEYCTQFGIRTIVADSTKVLLNGHPVFFTGVARHEDHPLYGRAVPDSVIYSDLVIMKNLNANLIRTAHYPNAPYTYLIADRIGFAITEEIPVWWFDDAVSWAIQNDVRHIHQQMFREMVFRDYNRPSILFWSTCNECLDISNRAIYIQNIQSDIKNNYNDGRLVTQSAAADRPGPEDVSEDNCDLAGWTMYFGIFYGSSYTADTQTFLQTANADHPDKPIMDTEFGYWSTQSGATELQQAQVFYLTFKAFAQAAALNANGSYNPNGYLMGVTWWCAFDWYTAQTGLQTMGIYAMDRKIIKKVGPFVQSAYKPYFDNGGIATGINENDEKKLTPVGYKLFQNYPNPFNPSTTFSYQLSAAGYVTLKVYDILGRVVALLVNEKQNAGMHTVNFNEQNLTSGVYVYQLKANGKSLTKKMVVLK